MTTKTEERYEGNYLDALDLPEGRLVPVTIEHWAEPDTEKDATGKLIKLGILTFKGKKKRLIVGKTSYKNLKAMFGSQPSNWTGKTVSIQRRYLDAAHGFGVQNCLCIRIIPPVGTPILKSALNFMGSPTPYGDVPKQAKKQEPAPAQTTGFSGTLAEWKTAIDVMTTLESCTEFRAVHLPAIPTHQQAEVEKMLDAREEAIRENSS